MKGKVFTTNRHGFAFECKDQKREKRAQRGNIYGVATDKPSGASCTTWCKKGLGTINSSQNEPAIFPVKLLIFGNKWSLNAKLSFMLICKRFRQAQICLLFRIPSPVRGISR